MFKVKTIKTPERHHAFMRRDQFIAKRFVVTKHTWRTEKM